MYFTFLNIFLAISRPFLLANRPMLEHWMPSCRSRFIRQDFDFLAAVLSPEGPVCHLEKLWGDPDGMREMLDLKEVFRAVIESPATIRVSPRFYFYVLVRHAFLRADLADVELADYVAGVLARRVGVDGSDPFEDVARGCTHAAGFLSFISKSKGRMRHLLQVAAGNQFLVLTGLYPDFIRKRNEMGIAPDMEFYESFAARSFRSAANHSPAMRGRSRCLYGTLADVMPAARRSLNRIAEEFVFLGE